MAARANSLTEHVTGAPSPPGTAWSMPARDARVFLESLDRLGYDAGSLRAAAGLTAADLEDPDARIPCDAIGTMVSRAQQQRFTPNLGLELARGTPIGAYPLLDYLVVTSETVAAGVQQLARYQRLVGNPVALDVADDAEGQIRVRMDEGAPPFSVEFVSALMVLHFRAETHGRFEVAHISFQHTPDDVDGFQRTLGCAVRPASAWNGLTVPRGAWQLPLRRRDPVLRHVLEAHAEDVLARVPARTGLARDVQRALTARVAGRDTRVGAIARELAMSARTLQRRLAGEGVSYQQLLDDARMQAAARYLQEPSLAICEVAYLVGYSEPAPFHRAFKRWYGMTPEIFRQRRRGAGALRT